MRIAIWRSGRQAMNRWKTASRCCPGQNRVGVRHRADASAGRRRRSAERNAAAPLRGDQRRRYRAPFGQAHRLAAVGPAKRSKCRTCAPSWSATCAVSGSVSFRASCAKLTLIAASWWLSSSNIRASPLLSLAWSDARGGEAVRTLIGLFQTRDPLIAGLVSALD